jgi:hypothetical protein
MTCYGICEPNWSDRLHTKYNKNNRQYFAPQKTPKTPDATMVSTRISRDDYLCHFTPNYDYFYIDSFLTINGHIFVSLFRVKKIGHDLIPKSQFGFRKWTKINVQN